MALAVPIAGVAAEGRKVTYEDDVLPIFRDNCLKCHNPDKLKGDLDLTSYHSALKGGGSGSDLNPGDPDGSQLYRSILHTDDPAMPPNASLGEKEIATIRAWIEGGLLQGANGKAVAANKPMANFALKAGSVGRPEGPPPMPGGLALNPVVRATRDSALSGLASSPWAPVIALTGAKQVVFYNTDTLDYIGVLPFPDGFPCDLKFSRDGKLLVAGGGRGGKSGLVTVWEIATGQPMITIGDQYDAVLAADMSADRKWIALGGPDRVLKIYNTKDGTLEHRIKKHTDWVTAVEFSPDGRYLASGDRNGGLVLWESESGQEIFTLAGHKAGITAISWRADSEMLLSASEDGTLKLWRPSDGTQLRSINAHVGGALAARFGRDGRIVSSGRDNKLQIWDASGKRLAAPTFTGDLPNRVDFSDDGKRIIGSDWRGKVYVWETATGNPVGELEDNPPPLVERVVAAEKRWKELQQKLADAAAEQQKSAAMAEAAEARLTEAAKIFADAQEIAAVGQADARKLAADSSDNAKAQLAALQGPLKAAKAKVAAAQKEKATREKELAAAKKRAADAEARAAELKQKATEASAALTRWRAALNAGDENARTPKAQGRPAE